MAKAPLRLRPGDVYGVYVHSEEQGDAAIVYDNSYRFRPEDDDLALRIHQHGVAHLNPEAFSNESPWRG